MRADKINDVDNISTPAIKNISINFLKKQSGKNFSLYMQRKKYNMHLLNTQLEDATRKTKM